jgi:hypothetical protein
MTPALEVRARFGGGTAMKRHHWLMIAVAAIFVAGWLLWNILLVEGDLTP